MIETLLPASALAFPRYRPGDFPGRAAGSALVRPRLCRLGILFAWWYGKKLLRSHRLWANNQRANGALKHSDDFAIWAAPRRSCSAGDRLCAFYNFSYYISNPLAIPASPRGKGGMSFHGGILGTTLAMTSCLPARAASLSSGACSTLIAAGAPTPAPASCASPLRPLRNFGAG